MNATHRVISAVDHILHRHVLMLVVLSYLLAAGFPAVGLWIKDTRILDVTAGTLRMKVTAPALLLAFLLLSRAAGTE